MTTLIYLIKLLTKNLLLFRMYSEKETSDLIKKLVTPFLLVLGLTGNTISIIIFSCKSMKNYTTFRFLTLISILDICCLYTGCTQIMISVYYGIDFRLLNEVSCKIQSFLVYFFTHFSSMLLAAMSIDRYWFLLLH